MGGGEITEKPMSGARHVPGRSGANGWTGTRDRVEDYFDGTATATWERLTSDAPVSGIRRTVRAGRDRMRALMLSRLPDDLTGARVLDAGCGAGQMTQDLAERGAEVVAVDISGSLVDVARRRLPDALAPRVTFHVGDMRSGDLGHFDHVVAMDSLIYYEAPGLCGTLAALAERTSGRIVFTVAPRTPLLMAMWATGRLFPKADRSPVMVPHDPAALAREFEKAGCVREMRTVERIHSAFYISTCMEVLE